MHSGVAILGRPKIHTFSGSLPSFDQLTSLSHLVFLPNNNYFFLKRMFTLARQSAHHWCPIHPCLPNPLDGDHRFFRTSSFHKLWPYPREQIGKRGAWYVKKCEYWDALSHMYMVFFKMPLVCHRPCFYHNWHEKTYQFDIPYWLKYWQSRENCTCPNN